MTNSRQDEHLGLVVAGWIMAVLLPVGGLVTGFALATRRPGHAFGILVLSVATITAALWWWFIVIQPPA